jgi:mRNA interferase MazF
MDSLNEVIVAPVTRTIRGLETEVLLTEEDGMPAVCAINFDHVSLGQRDRFGAMMCRLPESRWSEARRALLKACGFE